MKTNNTSGTQFGAVKAKIGRKEIKQFNMLKDSFKVEGFNIKYKKRPLLNDVVTFTHKEDEGLTKDVQAELMLNMAGIKKTKILGDQRTPKEKVQTSNMISNVLLGFWGE